MGRAPCCDKANVKKGPWSPEEDAKLKSYIEQHGTGGNWIALPQKIGLKRCGKSCRLRWLNYLRPNIKHGGFSEEEDNIICSLYISIGSRWSIIAAQLPGRTDNDIKNYWNTRLKKKLLGKQRKEHQHARRGSSQKQEMLRKAVNPMIIRPENTANHLVSSSSCSSDYNTNQINPYWPDHQLPLLTPIPYSTHEPRFNDHASIRKLLIKLGGKFSDEDDDQTNNIPQYPLDHNNSMVQVQPVYNDHDHHQQQMNMLSAAASVDVLNASSSLPTETDQYNVDLSSLQGQNMSFSHGLEQMMYNNNPQRLDDHDGLEFLSCGDHVLINGTTKINNGINSDCGEMMNIPLVFPPATGSNSSFEGLHEQGAIQECGIDQLRYLIGPQ